MQQTRGSPKSQKIDDCNEVVLRVGVDIFDKQKLLNTILHGVNDTQKKFLLTL